MQGSSLRDVSSVMIEIFQTQSWQFVQALKFSNVKSLYDCRDLEGQAYHVDYKVLSLCILGVNIKSVPQTFTD